MIEPQQIAETLVGELEGAWNSADGVAYGKPFTAHADFVTIRGDHMSGQAVLVQVDDDWRIGAFHNTLITA